MYPVSGKNNHTFIFIQINLPHGFIKISRSGLGLALYSDTLKENEIRKISELKRNGIRNSNRIQIEIKTIKIWKN